MKIGMMLLVKTYGDGSKSLLKWHELILKPINLWSLPMGFIQHTNCPKCGSRDNLAEYDDNFFCFGCGYTKQKNTIEDVKRRLQKIDEVKENDNVKLTTTKDIPIEPKRWLLSYGITAKDVSEYSLGWSEDKKLLVLVNTDDFYQGRCFGGQRTKYLSKGKKPLLSFGNGDTIVCVEDVLSAIKLDKAGYIGVPLLGSHVSTEQEQWLLEQSKPVVLWLDYDKTKESYGFVKRLQSIGVKAQLLVTPKDPKDYTIGEINEWLKNRY